MFLTSDFMNYRYAEQQQVQQGFQKVLTYKFPDLQAGFISNSNAACAIAEQAGFEVLRASDESGKVPGLYGHELHTAWSSTQSMANTLLASLSHNRRRDMPVGFSPSAKRAEGFDLLLVYLTQQMFSAHSNNEPLDTKGKISQSRDSLSTANEASTEQLVHKHQSLYSWLNSLVGCLRNNSAVEEQLLLVLVLGNVPGCNTTTPQRQQMSQACSDFPAISQPIQSHCVSDMQTVVPHSSQVGLMVQHLPGIVRRDAVQRVSFSDTRMRGGGGCILAEHILPELAYKLGKAPKYGA